MYGLRKRTRRKKSHLLAKAEKWRSYLLVEILPHREPFWSVLFERNTASPPLSSLLLPLTHLDLRFVRYHCLCPSLSFLRASSFLPYRPHFTKVLSNDAIHQRCRSLGPCALQLCCRSDSIDCEHARISLPMPARSS